MDLRRHVTSDPPERGAMSAEEKPVPLHFDGVLISGPRWAIRLLRYTARLAPVGRLLCALVVGATWVAVIGGSILVVTDRGDLVGLSETSSAYRPLHVVVMLLAFFAIAFTAGDAVRMQARNRAARGERRPAGTRQSRRSGAGRRSEAARARLVTFSSAVDGLSLPDDVDLRNPNGFTGTGTHVPGAP